MSSLEIRPGVPMTSEISSEGIKASIDLNFARLSDRSSTVSNFGAGLDIESLYGDLAAEGLKLPVLLTNNPKNDQMAVMVTGRRRSITKPSGGVGRRHKSILDTRAVTLYSGNNQRDEMNPQFVYRVTLGGTPMAYEGFQEYTENDISQQGKVARVATIQDLRLTDYLIKKTLEIFES